jgi:hypothetical protein
MLLVAGAKPPTYLILVLADHAIGIAIDSVLLSGGMQSRSRTGSCACTATSATWPKTSLSCQDEGAPIERRN